MFLLNQNCSNIFKGKEGSRRIQCRSSEEKVNAGGVHYDTEEEDAEDEGSSSLNVRLIIQEARMKAGRRRTRITAGCWSITSGSTERASSMHQAV